VIFENIGNWALAKCLPGIWFKLNRSLIFFVEINCNLKFTTYFTRYSFISTQQFSCVNQRGRLFSFHILKLQLFLGVSVICSLCAAFVLCISLRQTQLLKGVSA